MGGRGSICRRARACRRSAWLIGLMSIALHVQNPDLAAQISWLTPRLPPVVTRETKGEADYYGAAHEIAVAVGLKQAPRSSATWRHGWSFLPLVNPEAFAGYKPGERSHLVSNLEEESFLREGGFPNAKAVGLPYLYTPVPNVQRRPSSVLVLPCHSLPEVRQHEEKQQHELDFATYSASLREHFETVCACVHGSCVKSGQWVDALESQGIPWVTGAMVDDVNTLRRIRTLFGSFEVVMTNQLGSAIFYAALDGARVCVSGPDALLPPMEAFRNHPFYQKHPEMIEMRAHGHPDRLRQRFPSLYVSATEARFFAEGAQAATGVAHQIDHAEVARLLGWRHCDADPDWQAEDREKARRVFGWMPSHYGSSASMEELGRTLKKLKLDAGAAAQKLQELKGLEKEAKSSTKAQAELATLKQSWAWRYLAKPFFSIEKRLRGWK